MSRILFITIALLLALPAVTSGAPAPKRHAYHWHGYGFLPGYHQPPNNAVPIYSRKGAVRGQPDYSPQYSAMTASGTISAGPALFADATMAAVSVRAGAGRRSDRR